MGMWEILHAMRASGVSFMERPLADGHVINPVLPQLGLNSLRE